MTKVCRMWRKPCQYSKSAIWRRRRDCFSQRHEQNVVCGQKLPCREKSSSSWSWNKVVSGRNKHDDVLQGSNTERKIKEQWRCLLVVAWAHFSFPRKILRVLYGSSTRGECSCKDVWRIRSRPSRPSCGQSGVASTYCPGRVE